MRSVVQRVSFAQVEVKGQTVARIERGVLALVGFCSTDQDKDFQYMIDKIPNLRIFEDDAGKMNLSVRDVNGGVILVPNFTLYGDARRGKRPSFSDSTPPGEAKAQFSAFCEAFRAAFPAVQTGVFQAEMKVSLQNDGPVTILLDSGRNF